MRVQWFTPFLSISNRMYSPPLLLLQFQYFFIFSYRATMRCMSVSSLLTSIPFTETRYVFLNLLNCFRFSRSCLLAQPFRRHHFPFSFIHNKFKFECELWKYRKNLKKFVFIITLVRNCFLYLFSFYSNASQFTKEKKITCILLHFHCVYEFNLLESWENFSFFLSYETKYCVTVTVFVFVVLICFLVIIFFLSYSFVAY